MSTYYFARNKDGDHIFDNFPSHLYHLIDSYKENQNVITILIDNKLVQARIGRKLNSFGEVFTLTIESKYVDRLKLFRELVDMSILSLEPLTKFQKALIDEQCSKTDELIHNITSLNTYSIQDLFALIPQRTLSENINRQKEIIKEQISSKPNVTIDTLLKLIKYNLAMKVEFSVYERTQRPHASIKKISHSIRSLVLSILQIFIDDFEKLKIEVSLDAGSASERRLEIDDDSLFVSLFYLLENSLKYCCPNTKYKIIFKEENSSFSILFIMISIKIEPNEVRKLTEYGYRSETAKAINAEGKGIGMYRITKTLRLNNAELEITPRINDYTRRVGKVTYEGNQFKIKFNGQQDWFK
jgi:hypothetical protein